MFNVKKLFTALICSAFAMNTLGLSAFSASAATGDSRTFVYDDYEIAYNVTNSWGNTEAVTVSITNTGNETIENWMLAYDDFNGEINDIWNAEIESTKSGFEYVKNSGHNANISPNQTISFSYNLENASGIPDLVVMTQKRLEKATAAYDAHLNVISEWDSIFQGEIVLSNNTDMPIEWWELTFDSNFTITEVLTSWAATVTDNGSGNYTFKGTYTGVIEPGSSVSLGFQAIKNGTPEISDVHLNDMIYDGIDADKEYNLEDIGEAYFKDIESVGDIATDQNGIQYVKNQFLVTAYNDVPYATMEALGDTYDADIVGYIELTNDYQFEIEYDVTATDLYDIVDEISENSYVEYSSINTVLETDVLSIPNDPWKSSEEIDWNITNPSGSNWGVEAINAPGAWDYINQMSTVKVGLIDSAFQEHEDLNFYNIFNNIANTTESHGNHVAGTMAAIFDNGIGVSGIIPNNKLYAVSRVGSRSISGEHYTAMEWKYVFTLLIGNDVKVINVSHRDYFNVNDGDYNSDILGNFLNKLIKMNYDFIIVAAAGNDGINSDAKDISLINRINIEAVKNRILVVGSIWRNNDYYQMSSFSSRGDRVDVVAPGGESGRLGVYSAVLNNGYNDKCGTSMATPHVSGTAGLVYSVNPNLSAEQVKQIIVDTSGGTGREFTDNLGGSYGIINAKAAVEVALETEGENAPTNDAVVFVRDCVTGRHINDATIRIQGRDPQNQDVDMYLTDGVKANIITGWYNMTVSANGYVTYRFNAYHSSEGFTIINLVEDNSSSNGTLQITAKDWINNAISNTEFNLYTINENFEKVLVNTDGTYPTTNGMTSNISLTPGYYLAEATTGFTQYTQELYPVAANHATNETYLRFGIEGVVETYGFEVNVDGNDPLNINFRLAARSSDESLRLDESIIATNVHPDNYDGVYFHFFDTEAVRNTKTFSIGFKLTQAEYNRIASMDNPSALSIHVMISHGLYGTPSTETIWLTGTDIINSYNSSEGFFEFATIAYDSGAEEYSVSSNYWLIDSNE